MVAAMPEGTPESGRRRGCCREHSVLPLSLLVHSMPGRRKRVERFLHGVRRCE